MHIKCWIYGLNYFLFFASISNILPFYIPLIETYTETDEAKIGYLFTFMPIASFVGKILFCFLADKYFLHKRILQISMLLNFINYMLFLVLPYANFSRITNWYLVSLFSVFGGLFLSVSISLIDTLTIVHVKKCGQNFGILRVFSSLGWGICSPIIGYISPKITCLPVIVPNILTYGFIMFMNIMLVTFCLEYKITPKKECDHEIIKIDIFKEVINIFLKYPSIVQYLIITLICGSLNGVIWTFYSLFLSTLTDNSLQLIGLSNFMPCLFSEIPVFLFSDKIIKFCGISNSFNLVLISLFIRFISYAFIVKPSIAYIVLLIDLTQGFTFALLYSALTKTANKFASKAKKTDNEISSIESTMQGLFCGSFEGLGVALGSCIGGILIKQRGIRESWAIFASIAFLTAILNIFVDFCKIHCKKKQDIESS